MVLQKLYYELDVIRFFISGLATSHFMILEGLSGTGKSSLPRYFAKFINANVLFVLECKIKKMILQQTHLKLVFQKNI